MSHPQLGPRVFLENGPHAGETLSVEPADDGYPPAEIRLDAPSRRPGVGDRTREAPDTDETGNGPVLYRRHSVDIELGIYRYRVSEEDTTAG